ncbi:flagellar export chaperone FliS [Gephyromycinifex aptenodytis]|uniref:flagellar export chaperone FliS n=1 Tax=Gephyromycinifex aptenodytis TaxID=2716227 RepID=UPI0014484727|nr:flagellar export chaperone FliS [Gephyromycinifex aptenodytis]
MTTQAQLRNRYARESVNTASPAKLVTMLYDRLIRDLSDAEQGLGSRDIQAAHNALTHAQNILWELHSTLDTSVWKEGEQLKRLYEWCVDELVAANVEKVASHVVDVRDVLMPISDAWHQVVASGETGER